MQVILNTASVLYPITLASLKLHLRVDSGSFSDNVDESQSLVPDVYAIQNNYTTHVGDGIDVLGYTALVVLNSGTNGATGTVDVKVQESDDDITYTDWPTGAFTQVTTVNDNAVQEIAYTGVKQYVRTVAKVLLATCEFATTVIRLTATTVEDDLLNNIIKSARDYVEDITRRTLLTATWEYYLDEWPAGDRIKLPFGNLQTTSLAVSYDEVDSDGNKSTETMTLTTDYLIETSGSQCGSIVLSYGETWPSFTRWPTKPIKIQFQAGWTTAALVPYKIKAACLLIAGDLYTNREAQVMSSQSYRQNETVMRLLASARLWDEFR